MDLKQLLIESKQKIPLVLQTLQTPQELELASKNEALGKGCAFCGGLGHRMVDCPKRIQTAKQTSRNTFGGRQGGDW
jgi:ATP-dependent RNA helicase DDX41